MGAFSPIAANQAAIGEMNQQEDRLTTGEVPVPRGRVRRLNESHDDIAATLHLPVGTVKPYLHRARKELREELKDLAGAVRDYLRYLRRHRSRGTPTPARIEITPS